MKADRIAAEVYGSDVQTLRAMMRVANALHRGERPSGTAWCKQIARQHFADPDAALAKLREMEDMPDPNARVRAFAAGASGNEQAAEQGFRLWQDYAAFDAANEIETRRNEADAPARDLKVSEAVKTDTEHRSSLRADIERAMGGPGLPDNVQKSVDAWGRAQRGEDAYPNETDDLRRTIAAAYDTANVEHVREVISDAAGDA